MADPIAKMKWYQVKFDELMNFSSADAEIEVTADNVTTTKHIHYDTPHISIDDGVYYDYRPFDAMTDAVA